MLLGAQERRALNFKDSFPMWFTSQARSPTILTCIAIELMLPPFIKSGSSDYVADIAHFVFTSSQNSTCSVAPRTIQEVQIAIKIIGRDDIRSPFALASGGHTYNPGFSSTPGVQLSLRGLDDLAYDPLARTIKVGSGSTYSDLYSALQPYNMTVVGGRCDGVGLGLLYGGGYSWYSNQYGLAIDNVVDFDLVLPNGTYTKVTQIAQPDLFFALRGGLNNFGVVTGATLKAIPSTDVFAGYIVYSFDQNEKIIQAIQDFSVDNHDEKAQIIAGFITTNGQKLWQIFFFHDSPDTSPTPFQPFLSIPSVSSTMKITTHSQFVKDSTFPPGIGTFQDVVPVLNYTVAMIRGIQLALNLTLESVLKDNRSISNIYWFAEPFHNHFTHGTFPSAYPHHASNPITPSSVGINYNNVSDKEYFETQVKRLSKNIQSVVVREGQGKWNDVKYSNYAIKGTPVQAVFGESFTRMRRIKASIDPKRVMDLLSGGFLV